MYVNGTIIDSTAANGSIPQYGSNPVFYIGTRCNSTMFFDGCLDDFKIYNCAINSTEVKTLFNEGITTDISVLNIENNFVAYPNPFNNKLTVILDKVSSIKINDISGKEIYSAKIDAGKSTIDAGSFDNGIYFITITDGQTSVTKKLIKN